MNDKILFDMGKWSAEFDEQGNCTKAVYDDAYLRLLGIESGADNSDSQDVWKADVHPDDKERIEQNAIDLFAKHPEGMDYDLEYRMMTKSGYHWFHDYGLCTRRKDGSVSRMDGVIFDIQNIVDKADAQKILAENNLRILSLADNFIALYDVELDTGHYELFFKGENNNTDINNYYDNNNYFESLRKYIDTIIYPEDREGVTNVLTPEAIRHELADRDHFDHYYRAVVYGKLLWFSLRIVYKDAARTHVIIGVFNAEEEMAAKQKEEQLRQELLNQMAGDEGVFLVDFVHDRRMTIHDRRHNNHGYEDSIGYSQNISKYIQDFVVEADRDMMRKATALATIRERLKKEKEYTVRYRCMSTGEIRFEEMRIVSFSETEALQSFRDIHETVVFEQANEALLKDTIGIYTIDLSDDIVWEVKRDPAFWDEAEKKTCAYTRLAASFMTRLSDKGRQAWKGLERIDGVRQFLREQDKREIIFDSPAGENRLMRVTWYVIDRIDGEANTVCFAFTALDEEEADRERLNEQIAAQKIQLEEALSMAQSANRAKTTFLNNMSHDIRTPMNAIIGYTGLAANHLDSKQQVQDYLDKIAQSSDHLLSLINDVLDMSRIESGKMNLEEKPENLADIIHTLHDIVLPDIQHKQHSFIIDIVDVVDDEIVCDKLRLNQVLLNILSNAIKYTAQGGMISMRITEKAVKPSGYATFEFCIKDNGLGMDKTYLKTIFDPFTRVQSTTVSGIQGTGLGMSITKNIIDLMGGSIEVQSEPGQGTQMTVTLDFKLQVANRQSLAIAELKGQRALVVDNDTKACDSACALLRKIGLRTATCATGNEAVALTESACREGDSFKVLIMDWPTAGMDGIETLHGVRKASGLEAPVIILTANEWTDREDDVRDAGAMALMTKPMFPSDWLRVLNDGLGISKNVEAKQKDDFDFSGRKVLLVEDNELNREIAVEILEEGGLAVEQAEDGSIAVRMLEEKGADYYDFVLMDIQMPIMDGYEATKAIRAMYPKAKLPIIALSANAFAEDKAASLEAGMNDHVAKPINISALFKALSNCLA